MAIDLKADNIVCVAVRPGIIDTDMTKAAGFKGECFPRSHLNVSLSRSLAEITKKVTV
jgi:NAD(P)-dependent dehydrogenase (short-subunit alcohol dehydrogenase family)